MVDIIRAVAVGLSGRISRRKEDELDEDDLVKTSNAYLDVLCRAFPEFQEVVDGEISPGDLRHGGARASLLGSATILRVLAGVYHELASPTVQRGSQVAAPMSDEEIVDFLTQLRPYGRARHLAALVGHRDLRFWCQRAARPRRRHPAIV